MIKLTFSAVYLVYLVEHQTILVFNAPLVLPSSLKFIIFTDASLRDSSEKFILLAYTVKS